MEKIVLDFYQKGDEFTLQVDRDSPEVFSFPKPYWPRFQENKEIDKQMEPSFGKSLFEEVFNTDKRREVIEEKLGEGELKSQERLNIFVRTDIAKIHELPWELLNKDRSFLLKKGNISLTRSSLSRSFKPQPTRPPYRILIISAMPLSVYEKSPIDPIREIEIVYKALGRHIRSGSVQVEVEEKASFKNIRRRITETHYDIIHFIGHGARGGDLLIESDEDYKLAKRLSGDELEDLWSGLDSSAVILNACHTATSARKLHLPSAAWRIHKAGIPLVIANQSPVRDDLAAQTMSEIYESIFRDSPYSSLNSARLELAEEWWKPVLFLTGEEEESALFEIEGFEREREEELPQCFTPLRKYQKNDPCVYRYPPIREATERLNESSYIILHGIGGAGKSFLGDYLAHFLRGRFAHVVGIDMRKVDNPSSLVKLISKKLDDNTSIIDQQTLDKLKGNGGAIHLWKTLNKKLNQEEWLLILDDFEVIQDEKGIVHDEWKDFVNCLIGDWQGRLIITTRLAVYLDERTPLKNVVEIKTFSQLEFKLLLKAMENGDSRKYLAKKAGSFIQSMEFHPLLISLIERNRPTNPEDMLSDEDMKKVLDFYLPYFQKYPTLKSILALPTAVFSDKLLELMIEDNIAVKDLIINRLRIVRKGSRGANALYEIIKRYALTDGLKIEEEKKALIEKIKDFDTESLFDKINKVKLLEDGSGNEDILQKLVNESISIANFFSSRAPDTAIRYTEKALRYSKKLNDQKYVAISYNNLGMVYREKGEYTKAIENLKTALKIREKALPADHPDIASSYGNLGNVYQEKGEYKKAIMNHERALKIRKKALPADHPHIASSYGNLGIVYREKGEYKKAIENHERALKMQKEALPANHPHIANSYNNLGIVYREKGELDKAVDNFNAALKAWEKLYQRRGELTYFARAIKQKALITEVYLQDGSYHSSFETLCEAAKDLKELDSYTRRAYYPPPAFIKLAMRIFRLKDFLESEMKGFSQELKSNYECKKSFEALSELEELIGSFEKKESGKS